MPTIARVEPLTTARALRGPFDYLAVDGIGVGSLLRVPFGHREVTGVVTALAGHSDVPPERLARPVRVLPHALPPELVDLAAWMAREYCSTFARAVGLMLPPAGTREKTALWAERVEGADDGRRLTAGQQALLRSLPRLAGPDLAALRRLERRGLVRIAPRAQRRAPVHARVGATKPPPRLTGDQEAALAAIAGAGPDERLLLHGVTGSGKNEVYLRAVGACLERGEGAIVLVPEIALTPQIGRASCRERVWIPV